MNDCEGEKQILIEVEGEMNDSGGKYPLSVVHFTAEDAWLLSPPQLNLCRYINFNDPLGPEGRLLATYQALVLWLRHWGKSWEQK